MIIVIQQPAEQGRALLPFACLGGAKLPQHVADPRKDEGRVSELPTMVALGDDYPELRESVHEICERTLASIAAKFEAEAMLSDRGIQFELN